MSKILGGILLAISSLGTGYMLGLLVGSLLPNVLVKVLTFLLPLSVGLYLLYNARVYVSGVLLDKFRR